MGSGEVSLEDSWSRGMWDVVCWFCIVLDDLGAVRLAQNGSFRGPFRRGNRAVVSKTGVFWPGSKAGLATAERALSEDRCMMTRVQIMACEHIVFQ